MDTLRWGIISSAKIAREKVIPGLQRADNCEVVAIGSRDRQAAADVAERWGIPSAYGSYEDVLADPRVDAVYVPVPNHLHARWTIAAAEAGKHVLCEKPLALTADEAQTMVDVCERAGVAFMEAFMYRLHPSWERTRELVDEGTIGELVAVDSWFSYFNDDPDNIRNIAEVGGGALMDIGCYCIDLSRLLFGAEPTAVASRMRRDPAQHVDTTTSALLGFERGTATFTCSTRAKADQYVTIHGTDGRIHLDVPFNIPADRSTEVVVHTGKALPAHADGEVHRFGPTDPYTVQGERFAAAVLAGTTVPTLPSEGVATMRVLDRVVAAAEAEGLSP
ncbi:MAG: gfo/Idh/MocA family oxidoreductase [Nitriliruptor sp.]|nr:MAG: gfo/Idh/MocA family oxidoreductase [Nitriliruptor sp.]